MQLLLLMASPMFGGVFWGVFQFIQMTHSIYVSAKCRECAGFARTFPAFSFLAGVEKARVTARTRSKACGMSAVQEIGGESGDFQRVFIPRHSHFHDFCVGLSRVVRKAITER